MIELTRRSFLKSLATLAASVAVPVEVTTTIDYLLEQPELPITQDSPSAYIILNGQKLPIANAGFCKEMGFAEVRFCPSPNRPGFYETKGHRIPSPPPEWTISIDAFGLREAKAVERLSGESVTFSIVPYNSDLRIEGEGSIGQVFIEDVPSITREERTPNRYGFEIITNQEPQFIRGKVL